MTITIYFKSWFSIVNNRANKFNVAFYARKNRKNHRIQKKLQNEKNCNNNDKHQKMCFIFNFITIVVVAQIMRAKLKIDAKLITKINKFIDLFAHIKKYNNFFKKIDQTSSFKIFVIINVRNIKNVRKSFDAKSSKNFDKIVNKIKTKQMIRFEWKFRTQSKWTKNIWTNNKKNKFNHVILSNSTKYFIVHEKQK